MTFYRKESASAHEVETGGGQETTQETTQKTTQKIIQAIAVDPRITRKVLAEHTGLTEDGRYNRMLWMG